MNTSDDFLQNNLSKHQTEIINNAPGLRDIILDAMDEYAEQECDLVGELHLKPAKKLKPLEDLWRKENYPCGKYVIPDTTKFYEWIANKILNTYQ